MSKSNCSSRKRYVYHPEHISKHTYLIHVPGYSSDECKVLREIGSKYPKSRPTKDRDNYPATKNKYKTARENAIVNHAVNEIIL